MSSRCWRCTPLASSKRAPLLSHPLFLFPLLLFLPGTPLPSSSAIRIAATNPPPHSVPSSLHDIIYWLPPSPPHSQYVPDCNAEARCPSRCLTLLLTIPQHSNSWDLFAGGDGHRRIAIGSCDQSLRASAMQPIDEDMRVTCAAAAALMLPPLPAAFSGYDGECLCSRDSGGAIINSGLKA